MSIGNKNTLENDWIDCLREKDLRHCHVRIKDVVYHNILDKVTIKDFPRVSNEVLSEVDSI